MWQYLVIILIFLIVLIFFFNLLGAISGFKNRSKEMFYFLFILLLVSLTAASVWLTFVAFRHHMSAALFLTAGLVSLLCTVFVGILYETEMKTGSGVGIYSDALYFFCNVFYFVAIGQAGFGLLLIIRNLITKGD